MTEPDGVRAENWECLHSPSKSFLRREPGRLTYHQKESSGISKHSGMISPAHTSAEVQLLSFSQSMFHNGILWSGVGADVRLA